MLTGGKAKMSVIKLMRAEFHLADSVSQPCYYLLTGMAYWQGLKSDINFGGDNYIKFSQEQFLIGHKSVTLLTNSYPTS